MSEEPKLRAFLRVAQTDLEGNKNLERALLKIKGVSFNFAHALCISLGFDPKKKAGLYSEEDAKKMENGLKDPQKIPSWMLNRRKDLESGADKHVVSGDLRFAKEFDIKHARRLKSYRGIRHSLGLPVRGQRTRSNFRKGKTVGVKKPKK